ncbi:MAG: hypothetical protein K2N12_05625 [Helicobacter sp.]|nr:hypothetical protein [Helicobacter sp.]
MNFAAVVSDIFGIANALCLLSCWQVNCQHFLKLCDNIIFATLTVFSRCAVRAAGYYLVSRKNLATVIASISEAINRL